MASKYKRIICWAKGEYGHQWHQIYENPEVSILYCNRCSKLLPAFYGLTVQERYDKYFGNKSGNNNGK